VDDPTTRARAARYRPGRRAKSGITHVDELRGEETEEFDAVKEYGPIEEGLPWWLDEPLG
jgi:hypothetical protein